MPHFGKTLRRLLRETHLSQREFAEQSGVSLATITAALKQPESKLRPTLYRKIAAGLGLTPQALDQKWREDRPMLPSPGIPVFEEVPAGEGDFDPTQLGQDEGRADWYIPRQLLSVSDPTAFAVVVRGDSMEPDYLDGDVVVCSPQAPQEPGMVAVYRMEDGTAGIKMVEAEDDGLLLVPRNPRHATRRVPRESVVRMARVVWQGRSTIQPRP